MARLLSGVASTVALVAGVDVQQCAEGTRYMSSFYTEAGDMSSCTECGQHCCAQGAVKYTWFDGTDPVIPGQCYCITGSSHDDDGNPHTQSGECGAGNPPFANSTVFDELIHV